MLVLKAPSFFALCPEPKLAPVSGERREVGATEAETRHDVQREALPGLSPPCAAHLPPVGRVGRSPNLTRGSKVGLVKREVLPWHSGDGCIFFLLTQHFPSGAAVLVTCATVFKQR